MPPEGQLAEAGPLGDERARRGAPWSHALLLCAAVAACYANSLRVPFLFDDPLPARRLEYVMRPVVWSSFALNRAVSGGDTWSYHLLNSLVHLACGLLLLACLRRAMACVAPHLASATRDGLALATALLWVCHPLQTAAVTYLSQRAEALAALFYLGTFYAFLRARESPPSPACCGARLWPALCVVFLALGFACKETVATAPLALLLADLFLLDGSARENWRRRRGLFALLALVALLLAWVFILRFILAHGASAGFNMEKGTTPSEYARSQAGVLLHYLRLALWPHPLVFDYGWPIARSPAVYRAQGAVVLALVLACAWLLVRRRWVGFAGALFFLILAPSSSIVPIKDLAFEHRMYLSLAPLSLLAVVGAWWLCRRRAPALRWLPGLLAGTCALVLCVLTVRRNAEFSSAVRLWTTVVERAPRNDRGYTNLAAALIDVERLPEARAALETALEIDPESVTALQNMGVTWMNSGDDARARGYFERALALKEDSALSHGYMAQALLARGDDKGAEVHLRRALEIDPGRAGDHYELGEILRRARRLDEAVAELRAAVEADPRHFAARVALGRCLAARGEIEPAIAALEQALALPGAAADPALTGRVRAELEVLQARAKSSGGAPGD